MKKNTVTKMLAVVVTIAMLGGLTACGSSSKEPLPVPLRQQEKPHRQRLRRVPQGLRQERMRQPVNPEW